MATLIKDAIMRHIGLTLMRFPSTGKFTLGGDGPEFEYTPNPHLFTAPGEVRPDGVITVLNDETEVEYTTANYAVRKMSVKLATRFTGSRDGLGAKSLSEAANEWFAEIAYALLQDPTRGGIAVDTRLMREFEEEEVNSQHGSIQAGIEFEVVIRHPYNDPYVSVA